MLKKTILIDLDGVLNTYEGCYDENFIPPIKEGAYELIKNLSHNYKIVIFTSRKQLIASQWIVDNNLDKFIEKVTNIKEPAYLMIDDRCITFNGNYKDLEKEIINFKVWYDNNEK